MTIAAIETTYRGYRFRSRLEARWAVAFDHLGVKWQYETQGYIVGGLERPYLPDFRLPALGIWAEVKGDPAALDTVLMEDAVSVKGGLPGADPFGEKCMLILGDIPPSDEPLAYLHWMVSRTAYAPCENFCACADARWTQVTFRSLAGPGLLVTPVGPSTLRPPGDVVTPRRCSFVLAERNMLDAFQAARSARFEHGEMPQDTPAAGAEPVPAREVLQARLGGLLAGRNDEPPRDVA